MTQKAKSKFLSLVLRHGSTHSLRVKAAQMYANGQAFYRADNWVLLTDLIDPAIIEGAE